MKLINKWVILMLAGGLTASAQPQDVYINKGFVDAIDDLPVNAVTFINEGSFSEFSSPLPFDTQNTLNYTNYGVMNSQAGFIFEHISDSGAHSKASSFFNGVGAQVNALSNTPNRVVVNATNVQNHGLISVGSSGLLSINGDHVDLSDGGLLVAPLRGTGSTSAGTNFSPEAGVFDQYWGGLTNGLVDSSGFLNVVGNSANIISPGHQVTNTALFPQFATVALQGADAFIISNAITETNIIVQAVFSVLGDSRIQTQVRFDTSPVTNNISTAMIEYSVPLTNVVTGSSDLFTLYMTDTLAWDTNLVFQQNGNEPTYKPSTYSLSRVAPFTQDYSWSDGTLPNAELSPDLLYNASFSNTIVTNFYAAYAALIESSTERDITSARIPAEESQPGRVEINANVLDLNGTRIRGEGLISLNTKHLVNTANSAIDVQNISYSLASTNKVLNMTGVSKPQVDRFSGEIYAYSTVWTNLSGIVIETPAEDPAAEPTMTTNVITYFYHMTVIDATQLRTRNNVLTHDLVAEATDVVIGDDLNVIQSFHIKSENLTVDSELNFFGHIEQLGKSNWPDTRNITVNGALSVNELAEYGSDIDDGLDSFINNGAVVAFSQRFKADYFENTGLIASGGRIEIEAVDGKLESGTVGAGRDLVLKGTNFKLRDNQIDASSKLFLDITGILTDSGPNANNNIRVNNGFQMLQTPANGDLLGTRLESNIPRFANVSHIWKSRDLGRSVSGFKNNSAIGTLVIEGPVGAKATFSSGGGSAAVYVDRLLFNDNFAQNWQSTVSIEDGMMIYFASSNIPVDELDGAFGGKLQWVPEYAGPLSGVPVVLSDGTSILVNQARKESLILDDDGDGVANGLDVTPFDGVVLNEISVNNGAQQTASISWMAAGSTTYKVEFKNDIFDLGWNYLKSVSNPTRERQVITVEDNVGSDIQGRFYRVSYAP
jgi:hypothetical protein